MRFAGYAALFDRADRGGDVLRPGAFAASLARGGSVPLLWQHAPGRPIGRIEYLREDWSHKSGTGRELRIAVTIRDQGESPARAQRLAGEAEAALAAIGGDIGGWRVVTMLFVRSQIVRPPREPWASLVEFRVRLLAA